ncbi:hypothetical protein ACOSQ2_019378 [Xanthoceras sorbifolium]
MLLWCNKAIQDQLHKLERSNPSLPFRGFFLSFHAQKHGFLGGCRPFIGLDGCHLKGPLGGVLLAAVALDANSGVYPLAVCICEAENLLSWGWFLKHLHDYLKYPTEKPLCFMSDRQKGVLSALEMQFPFALQGFVQGIYMPTLDSNTRVRS